MVSNALNIIAVIPARGGSKRIEKKNIKPFNDKPMIGWTIEAALATERFKKVIVSTDDQQTADIAESFGAECPFLRLQNADDQSSVSLATIHALDQAEAHYNEQFDIVVQLMPNCPLRSSQSINNAIDQFLADPNCQYLLSHTRYGWLNPWWACEVNRSTNEVAPLFPEQLKQRSQDLPDLFCINGAIWIAKSDALRSAESFHGPNKKAFILDWREAIDIDDLDDWVMAEAVSTTMKI